MFHKEESQSLWSRNFYYLVRHETKTPVRSDDAAVLLLLLQLLPRLVFVLCHHWLWVAALNTFHATGFGLPDATRSADIQSGVARHQRVICDCLRSHREQFTLHDRSSWERTIHMLSMWGLFVWDFKNIVGERKIGLKKCELCINWWLVTKQIC